MTTSRVHRRRLRSGRPEPWSLLTAMVLTCGSFAAVLLSLRQIVRERPSVRDEFATATERITFVSPRHSPFVPYRTTPRSRPTHAIVAPSPGRDTKRVPRDTGTMPAPTSAPATRDRSTPTPSLSIDIGSRLLPPSGRLPAWYSPRRFRDPFAPPAPPTAAERDSTLSALATLVPDLAARREPTPGERDSAAKEAMLKIRNTGRILLVPPDNSGGLITARIPLPFLAPGRSKAARERGRRALDENRARLQRLLARAESLRLARADSLRRSLADSQPR